VTDFFHPDGTIEHREDAPIGMSPGVPAEQMYSGEGWRHKAQLRSSRIDEVMSMWTQGIRFTSSCIKGFTTLDREMLDDSHILANNVDGTDLEMCLVDTDLMHDRTKMAARKSDRRTPQFDINFHAGLQLYAVRATRTRKAWEAERQHKSQMETTHTQRYEQGLPAQPKKRGFLF